MVYRKSHVLGISALVLATAPLTSTALPVLPPEFSPSESVSVASPSRNKVMEGLDALKRNDLVAAERAFNEANKLDSRSVSPYLGLAEIAGRKNQFAAVESLLKRAMALDPGSVEPLVIWGRYQSNRGKFKDAEASLKKAIALDPNLAASHVSLAENYLVGLKDPVAAEGAYRKAIQIDRNNVAAHLGLGTALATQNKGDLAIQAFENATRLAPKNPAPTHTLARFYASKGEFDKALVALSQTVRIAPDYASAWIDRGDLYLMTNRPKQAVADYQTATKTSDKPAIAYFKLGALYQGQEKWNDAENAYLAALKEDSAMYEAYNNLAWMAAVRKTRLDDALVWIKTAIQATPKATTLYDTLGWVHRARGDLDLAQKAVEKAVQGTPGRASFRYHLGIIYSEQGKTKLAIAALQKSLKNDKNFPNAADARQRLEALGVK